MLIWLLNVIFSIVIAVLRILLWALPVLFILKLVIPGNKYLLLAERYCNVVLTPVRGWLRRTFPKLFTTGFDYSPIALWLLVQVAIWAVQLLRSILL